MTERESSESYEYDIEVWDLVHYYGKTKALDHVGMKVTKGEFLGILGPSGSGKTTLLRIIGGFIFPTSGSVYIQGELMGRTPPYQRNTTMVFQHLALFPHMKVFDNVAYGLKISREAKDEIIKKVARTLRLVKLEGLENRYPKELSGGQQQRVALARAIVLEPSVVLFDEPLGALDLKLRREMEVELKNLQKIVGTTFIYVTHDQEEALTMSDRIAVMNEGKIEQTGSAEEVYERPETKFVADFIGDTNVIDGKVASVSGKIAVIECKGVAFRSEAQIEVAKNEAVAISVRPGKIQLGQGAQVCDNVCRGAIEDIVYTGAQRRCMVRLRNGYLLKVDLAAHTSRGLVVGQETQVGWHISDGYVVK